MQNSSSAKYDLVLRYFKRRFSMHQADKPGLPGSKYITTKPDAGRKPVVLEKLINGKLPSMLFTLN